MNRLQLATLMSWTRDGKFQGRKRLQKVVFFLQEAGCTLDCNYTLHHFGPYSRDVADRCDEMVAAGLIEEHGGRSGGDQQYTYTLKPQTRAALSQTTDPSMLRFQALGAELISENIWTLELGSTILYFYRQMSDWNQALTRACEFKKVPAIAVANQFAMVLARRFEAHAGN